MLPVAHGVGHRVDVISLEVGVELGEQRGRRCG